MSDTARTRALAALRNHLACREENSTGSPAELAAIAATRAAIAHLAANRPDAARRALADAGIAAEAPDIA